MWLDPWIPENQFFRTNLDFRKFDDKNTQAADTETSDARITKQMLEKMDSPKPLFGTSFVGIFLYVCLYILIDTFLYFSWYISVF